LAVLFEEAAEFTVRDVHITPRSDVI